MSEVQYSEDGQWWWDEASQQWHPVAAAENFSDPNQSGGEPAADAGAVGPLASLSDDEVASYFQQALDAGISEVYEA